MNDIPNSSSDDQLPRPIDIPRQLLDQWFTVPKSDYVEIALTRGQIEQFFYLLDGIIKNQQLLSQLVVDWSNGNLEQANKALRDSRFTSAQASNDLTTWFTALMTSALAQRTGRNGPTE
jgi:hypothetical protein